jgi:5'(3')-deoxyribonucleotidase
LTFGDSLYFVLARILITDDSNQLETLRATMLQSILAESSHNVTPEDFVAVLNSQAIKTIRTRNIQRQERTRIERRARIK